MKTPYLIAGLFILLIVASVFLVLSSSKNKSIYKPAPIIQFQPSPSIPQSTNNLSSEDKIKLQLEADKKIAGEREALLQKYPWFLTLPWQETNYFVYFNPPSETFIAKLYPQKTSPISLDEQTNNLKAIVIEKINQLGTDAGSYKVEWKVIPE